MNAPGPSPGGLHHHGSGGLRRLGAAPLTEGAAVTVLVGIGLELAVRRRDGQLAGPLPPAAVVLGADGRPRLAGVTRVTGWSGDDDVGALLRLGCALAPPGSPLRRAVHSLVDRNELRLRVVLDRLVAAAPAEPLVVDRPRLGPGARWPRPTRGSRRGRHAARRRWWGRRT
ncbi:MAG: hypothetical protein OEV62_07735 [Actinomycetota bacterium]|nr:hypothetical protein [Actinomycetota bacterium]